MRHGTHAQTPTVAQVVHRAVEVCDPAGTDAALGDYLARFEDRDEPVTALGGQRTRVFFETEGFVEGQDPDPALVMAAAVATYLAFRRDELSDDDGDLLRLAVRAEFGAHVPPDGEAWLAARGIVA